ncbi:PilN domain-containing protein [Desulforhopalus singaporensis]|uniref:Fimbrial assembly protein (PilN) n=1 Tax=Desulforhopalus singaporensis TaxID=91360 RepID=A0A1H0M1K2_9BACT|nr:PilN domain-containing protein [Desulforhopalus singaporensis]SDO74275.1 Fimbrial assembly protein (PilN) [Desulforhopalus singaporensis]
MTENLFCLELQKDSFAAIVVDASSRAKVVTDCCFFKDPDLSLEQVAEELKQKTGTSNIRCVLLFSPDFFLFHNLSLPFGDKKKIAQVLPYELTENSPVAASSLVLDFLPSNSTTNETDILLAGLSRELLSKRLSTLAAAGLDPDRITISGEAVCLNIAEGLQQKDFVLLNCQEKFIHLFLVRDGAIVLIRSIACGSSSVEATVLEISRSLRGAGGRNGESTGPNFYLSGNKKHSNELADCLTRQYDSATVQLFAQSEQPFIKIDEKISNDYDPERMDQLLAQTVRVNGKGFNFRKDEFKKSKSIKEYRSIIFRTGIPLLLLAVIFFGYQGYKLRELKVKHETLRHEIATVFQETVPEVTRIVNPIQQLKVINNNISTTYKAGIPGGGEQHSMIGLLIELSARIPRSYKIKITRLVADLDTVRIKALTSDFNTVDNIQKELEKSAMFSSVTISSANQTAKGDNVRFELNLKLAR